ncbi:hypothetical protein NQ317_002872, partial [Molorchus minor]
MYSNHLKRYVEVGNVSLYDSYLSKRLLFTYTVNKDRKYPKVVGGTLLNVPKLLACVLENNNSSGKNILMSDIIKKHLCIKYIKIVIFYDPYLPKGKTIVSQSLLLTGRCARAIALFIVGNIKQ